MQRLFQIIENVRALNVNALINEILSNPEIQKKILDLNRIGQLYEKGVNSNEKLLSQIGGEYSGFTLDVAIFKGQPKKGKDIVNLHDTGEFYESFQLILGGQSFTIEANTIKEDTDLAIEWGEEILGLSESSKEMLILWVKNEIIPKVKEFILS